MLIYLHVKSDILFLHFTTEYQNRIFWKKLYWQIKYIFISSAVFVSLGVYASSWVTDAINYEDNNDEKVISFTEKADCER